MFAFFAATEALTSDLAAIGSRLKVTALCPGTVATAIATGSEGHRPPHLATEATEDQTL